MNEGTSVLLCQEGGSQGLLTKQDGLHTGQNDHHQKVYKQYMLGKGMERKECSCTVGGNIN